MNPAPDHGPHANECPAPPDMDQHCILVRVEGTNRFVLPSESPNWLAEVLRHGGGTVDLPNLLVDFDDPHGFAGAFVGEWNRRRAGDVRSLRSGLFACPTADGDENYFELAATTTSGADQLAVDCVGTGRDSAPIATQENQISWLRRAEDAHRAAVRLMAGGGAQLPPSVPTLCLTFRDDGLVEKAETPPRYSVPVSVDLDLPAQLADVLPMRCVEQILAHTRIARSNQAPQTFEITRKSEGSGGTIAHVQRIRVEIVDSDRMRAILYDVSERTALRRHLKGLAVTDPLTGTANRTLLAERMARAVARCQRYGRRMAVLVLDLDGFTELNETYGRVAGDQVLREAGRRLTTLLRTTDTLSRWRDDSFVFVIEEVTEFEDAEIVAQKMLALFEDPMRTGAQALTVTGSIGVAVFPDHATSEEQLVEVATSALETSRRAGRSGYCLSGREPEFALGRRRALRRELREGIEQGQFHLAYQPVCRAANRRWVGAEAYVRWDHPSRGRMLPGSFLRPAEASGALHQLDRHVLAQALSHASSWPEISRRRLPVAVNLARQTLSQTDLTVAVIELVRQAGLDPQCLEIEVSERIFASAGRPLYRKLRELRRLGIGLAIDDFGTGDLSLRELRQLRPTRIKIDHQFVSAAGRGLEGEQFCRAIIGIAEGFGAQVVAQGVETSEDEEVMRRLGCELIQGYRLARPMSAQEFGQALWAQLEDANGVSRRIS